VIGDVIRGNLAESFPRLLLHRALPSLPLGSYRIDPGLSPDFIPLGPGIGKAHVSRGAQAGPARLPVEHVPINPGSRNYALNLEIATRCIPGALIRATSMAVRSFIVRAMVSAQPSRKPTS